MARNGASPEVVATFAADLEQVNRICATEEEKEGERDKIVSWTFNYKRNLHDVSRQITITSEGSRHWRAATTQDTRSIVFLVNDNEFGEFDDLEEEDDEEFPDETHTCAVILSQSGRMTLESDFEFVKVVPDEVLEGVSHEPPPGKFFSGRDGSTAAHATGTSLSASVWSPAPPGMVWFKHPMLEHPNGTYYSDRDYYHLDFYLKWGSHGNDPEWLWELRGSKAYWCPVVKRFISEGERLRMEHWFHNGDGSAQQRYFYNQFEMLDRYGGLSSLPATQQEQDSTIDDVTITNVRTPQEILDHKFHAAGNARQSHQSGLEPISDLSNQSVLNPS